MDLSQRIDERIDDASRDLGELLLSRQLDGPLPSRPLGRTGEHVSILCLGGWHAAQMAKERGKPDAIRMMHRAIDEGLTFFDNAWDYHDGMAETVMGEALTGYRDRVFLMTKVCERDGVGAKANLEDSLRRLNTDHIDLLQFHETNYDNDPEWVVERGGLQALLEARQEGKVRHIGFTGHKHPLIHNKMLDVFEWDTVQMPINVCDWHYRSFTRGVLPNCLRRGIGAIGMKSLGGGDKDGQAILLKSGWVTAEECLRYALSQPISALVTGIQTEEQLDQALAVARNFVPLPPEELTRLREKVSGVAGDGRYELFKSTNDFDGENHRIMHGFGTVKKG